MNLSHLSIAIFFYFTKEASFGLQLPTCFDVFHIFALIGGLSLCRENLNMGIRFKT